MGLVLSLILIILYCIISLSLFIAAYLMFPFKPFFEVSEVQTSIKENDMGKYLYASEARTGRLKEEDNSFIDAIMWSDVGNS